MCHPHWCATTPLTYHPLYIQPSPPLVHGDGGRQVPWPSGPHLWLNLTIASLSVRVIRTDSDVVERAEPADWRGGRVSDRVRALHVPLTHPRLAGVAVVVHPLTWENVYRPVYCVCMCVCVRRLRDLTCCWRGCVCVCVWTWQKWQRKNVSKILAKMSALVSWKKKEHVLHLQKGNSKKEKTWFFMLMGEFTQLARRIRKFACASCVNWVHFVQACHLWHQLLCVFIHFLSSSKGPFTTTNSIIYRKQNSPASAKVNWQAHKNP